MVARSSGSTRWPLLLWARACREVALVGVFLHGFLEPGQPGAAPDRLSRCWRAAFESVSAGSLSEAYEQDRLGNDHPFDLRGINALV